MRKQETAHQAASPGLHMADQPPKWSLSNRQTNAYILPAPQWQCWVDLLSLRILMLMKLVNLISLETQPLCLRQLTWAKRAQSGREGRGDWLLLQKPQFHRKPKLHLLRATVTSDSYRPWLNQLGGARGLYHHLCLPSTQSVLSSLACDIVMYLHQLPCDLRAYLPQPIQAV